MRYVQMMALYTVLCLLIVPTGANAQDDRLYESNVSVGAGCAGVLDSKQAAFAEIEIRPGVGLGPFEMWMGLHANDSVFYAALGLLFEWWLTDRLFIAPSFGIGVYSEADGLSLGSPLEFRSGIQAGYRFENAHRLSVAFRHVSNGGIDKKNPGSELFSVLYSIPLSLQRREP